MSDVMQDVAEIHRLLREAYDHYFANSDGYCKSSEGVVSLHWPTYFDMRDGKTEPSCSVWSYVLGPSRDHHFDTTAEALAAVREWHREEMAHDYREGAAAPCPATYREPLGGELWQCDLDAGHDDWHQTADGRASWNPEAP